MSRLLLQKVQVILGTDDNVILWMSNEAHFHLNEAVNKQTRSYWAPEHPILFTYTLKKKSQSGVLLALLDLIFFKRIGLHLLLIPLDTLVCLKPELRRQQLHLHFWF